MDTLNSDYERLQKENHRLQKEADTLQDEKIFLQAEVDRLHQESDLREITLRGEEDRSSRMREELLSTREELNKLYLAHDMLEQQKLECDSLLGTLEKSKGIMLDNRKMICTNRILFFYLVGDLEIQLDRILSERTDAHESLLKKENLTANLEFDKKKLQDDLKKVTLSLFYFAYLRI